nr:RNA polymerase sigma factor [Bacillus suaedae]
MYDQYFQLVYKTAYYIVKDPHWAQDITQETFLKIFNNIDQLQDGSKLKGWIGRIATTTSIDFLRKKNKRSETPTDDVYIEIESNRTSISHTVEKEFELNLLKKQVKLALSDLKPEYKEVILLKYTFDLKDAEISEAIGLSVSATKSRLHRAKQSLREVYVKQNSGEEVTLYESQ